MLLHHTTDVSPAQSIIAIAAATIFLECHNTCSTGGGQIDTLILVDRTVDPLTPLCTQLTYEGLVDETLHIKNGVVQIGAEGERSRFQITATNFHKVPQSCARQSRKCSQALKVS